MNNFYFSKLLMKEKTFNYYKKYILGFAKKQYPNIRKRKFEKKKHFKKQIFIGLNIYLIN